MATVVKAKTIEQKLEVFDRHADAAVNNLINWLDQERGDLIVLARGRHVEGHYRYGDKNFAEWGFGELKANTAQELADAIVYMTRILNGT